MNFIINHWTALSFGLYAAWSAFVDSLDEPRATDGHAYKTFYRFAHAFAANPFTAAAKFGRTPWANETPMQNTQATPVLQSSRRPEDSNQSKNN